MHGAGFVMHNGHVGCLLVPLVLRCLEEGKLLNAWRKTVADGKVIDEEEADAFYRSTLQNINSRYTENLEFLLRGSPKMRAMLPIIVDQMILYGEKSTVWTMFPAEHAYVAAAIHEAGIEYGVLHGRLDTDQRHRLIHTFTTEARRCMVLVCSYSVDSSGLNLQSLCRNVLLDFRGEAERMCLCAG
jgi:hypothetical protein